MVLRPPTGVGGGRIGHAEESCPMRHALLYPVVCVLSLVTAAALLLAGATVGTAPVLVSPSSSAGAEVAVRAFYEAANAAIRTGNPADLAAAVSAAFVDHAPPPGVAPDRAGLSRYLAALHATWPRAELAVADLVAVGDRALVRVAVRGADPVGFLGLPPAGGPTLWGAVDVWRVAGGRVVERWGDADRVVLRARLGQIALGTPVPPVQVVALERLTVAPGGHLETELPDEARLLYLEAGTLTVAVAPGSPGSALLAPADAADPTIPPAEIGPGSGAQVRAGDLLALPPLTAYALRNDAAVPAAALVVAIHRPGAAAYATAQCDSSAADRSPAPTAFVGRPLAGDRETALPAGPVAVAIGRVTLGYGADLAVPAVPGPVLLYVETGTAALDTGAGAAWVGRGGSGDRRTAAAAALGAGDGAQPRRGGRHRARGDAPAERRRGPIVVTATGRRGASARTTVAAGARRPTAPFSGR
jgi:predicted ester cyclase